MELGVHADTEKLHPGPGYLDGSHPHQKALQPRCLPGHACPWEKRCGQRNKECENAGGDSSAFRPNVRFHHERKIRASHIETILFTKVKMERKMYFCLVFAFLFLKVYFIEEYLVCNVVVISGRRRQWHPTPVLLPGKSHGRSSLVGCSPWGR